MMSELKTMTEEELRDFKVPWPKTKDELQSFVDSLVDRKHEYGTCVYAISMASLATFYYVSGKLGVTGFQASCADMDFVKRNRSYDLGFTIVDYGKLLYPQYEDDTIGFWEYIKANKDALKKEALKLLADKDKKNAHPNVIAHWEKLAS
jgi:hypothetical protein